MAIKPRHSDTFSTYFITFTCAEWLPLFKITNSYDLVYKWFAVVKQKYNADVVAYVIMPNHLHVILHLRPLLVFSPTTEAKPCLPVQMCKKSKFINTRYIKTGR